MNKSFCIQLGMEKERQNLHSGGHVSVLWEGGHFDRASRITCSVVRLASASGLYHH